MADHRPRKRFGQHFLHDPLVIDRIIRSIGVKAEDHIVEIGPGPGVLTELLASSCNKLTAIEIDRDLAAALTRRFSDQPHVQIICADALNADLGALGPGLRLVGNLPYNISTPLLFRLDAYREHIVDACFMLQKEVVDRMVAAPGSRTYGRLSVMLQLHWQMHDLFDVGPEAFRPPPKVNSAVVRLQLRTTRQATVPLCFGDIVKAAFAQRRKTLRNALSGWLDDEQIAAAGIDPSVRAERLSVEDFIALALQLPLENE